MKGSCQASTPAFWSASFWAHPKTGLCVAHDICVTLYSVSVPSEEVARVDDNIALYHTVMRKITVPAQPAAEKVACGGQLLAPSCPPGAFPWAVGAESLPAGPGEVYSFSPQMVQMQTPLLHRSNPPLPPHPPPPIQERWRSRPPKREERELHCSNSSRCLR